MTALFSLPDAACRALAERHGTPLFAYHLPVARAQFTRLRAALPPRVRLAYAVKANPHPGLLACFAALGASFDCASGGELARVAELGLEPGRTFYAGPGKRTPELAQALSQGVRIQAEGWEDLERLEDLLTGRIPGPPVPQAPQTPQTPQTPLSVNLRVHPSGGIREASRIIGGTGPSAFGVDEEDLPAFLARAASLTQVRIRGLHVFAASNELDAGQLLATHGYVLELARRLQEVHGLDLEQIDLGGGLGVPYTEAATPLEVAALGQGLAALLAAHSWFQGELILEPGRFLSAPCGIYLCRVVRVKESRGVRFAILEGGVNHLLRPLLTGQPFPVRAVDGSGPLRPATLAGPLCTSLDRLGEVELPDLEPGTLLAFGSVGAYGFTEAMAPFLSHPVPPELLVEDAP